MGILSFWEGLETSCIGFFIYMIPYHEQLKDRRWNDKRTEILLRDNWQCQHTGCRVKYERLEVHHIEYIDGLLAWEYPNESLITLCHYHHSDEQDRKQLENRLLKTLKSEGFLVRDLLAFDKKLCSEIGFTHRLLSVLRKDNNV